MLSLSIVLFSFAVAANTISAAPSGPEALMRAVQAAERSGDVTTLARLTSPEFEQEHATGAIEPREAYLVAIRARAATTPLGRGFLERDVRWRKSGNTAIRTSITRIRGAKGNTDVWVRATAVVASDGSAWHLLNLDSALLYEGPTYDAPIADLPTAMFSSKVGGAFSFLVRDGQPYLELEHGLEIPLIALAANIFWEGPSSTLTVVRDNDGRVTSVIRKLGDHLVWTAIPLNISRH